MPLFDTTQVNYEIPVDNRLGDFGVNFDVGKVIWIASADNAVKQVFSIKDPTDIDLAKVGSGDFGKAIFRRGKTYEITDAEEFILVQAGLTTTSGKVLYPGDDIQAAVDAGDPGDTYLLQAGTFAQQSVLPQAGDTFIGTTGTVMDGQDITATAFRGLTSTATPDVTLVGIEITGYTQVRTGVVQTSDNSGWVMTNLEVHHNRSGAGIQHGFATLITGCHIHHNGSTGILSVGNGSDGSVIDDCEVSYNNFLDGFDPNNEAGGSKWLQTDGMTVKNCHFHNNHDNGIWFDANNLNIIIEDNLVEDNLGNGIFYEISYGPSIIRNNTVIGNKYGIRISTSSDVEIHGNTVTALDGNWAFWATDAARGDGDLGTWRTTDMNVHDNTFIAGTEITAGVFDVIGAGAVFGAPANNVFTANDHRCFALDCFLWDDNAVKKIFSAWQAAGHDAAGSYTQRT